MGIVASYNDNQMRDLQLVATLGSYIANFAGFGSDKKVVKPSDLMPEAFRAGGGGTPSKEWLDAQYERHEKRLERERRKKAKSNGDNR